jgi:hypothetical protein
MSLETMTKLATYTVGAGGDSSVSFSNIPQTYTDLHLVVSARDNRATVLDSTSSIKFNDSTTGYSYRVLYGSGSSASSANYSVYPTILQNSSGATSNTFSNCSIYIPNYTSPIYKSLSADSVDESNTSSGVYIWQVAGLWSNTSAINKITITPDTANNYVQYTTFTLYGVKAMRTAAGNSIKATGGAISFDGTYVTHTFNTSGSFTPAQPIYADYLVVAGGGGGAGDAAGGGGAGGYRTSISGTALSLTAQAYTVTVGAGGAGTTNTAVGTKGSNSVFSTITSTGGGGGKSGSGGLSQAAGGGSGGGGHGEGATSSYSTGGAGNEGSYSPAEGTNGGVGAQSGSNPSGGGGGGATSAGGAGGNNTGGTGGAGTASSITGTSVTYAGGGGGGARVSGTGGTGGAGGGGNGGANSGANGSAGTTNLGGGGGGGGTTGGTGGSGVVIIRYKG